MPGKPFFVVPLDLGAISAGNETAGYAAANLNRQKEFGMTWKSAGNANLWVRGNFGSAKPVDFLSLVSANAVAGTQIRLRLGDSQAEVDGTADYDSGAVSFINPAITREDGLYHCHLELPAIQTEQWWRIDITGHTGNFQAANLVMGKKLSGARYYNSDYEYGARDLGDLAFSRFGVLDETPGTVLRSVGFTMGWVSEAEFETMFRPLSEKLGRRGIVFVCFDPEATTYRQARTYLGVFDKLPFARGIRKPKTVSMDYLIVSMI